jgi:hypothetical protein
MAYVGWAQGAVELGLSHKTRVLHLYRHSLKTVVSWCVRREVFWAEVCARALPGVQH